MKRSCSSSSKRGRKCNNIQNHYSGPSFSNLPKKITEDILLRLSVKRIFVCKSVCKTWYVLISDSAFAKLHFERAQVCPLLRSSGFNCLSRMLYLVQPEKNDFELKLDMCNHREPDRKCFCHIKFKLDTKLRLPLRNLEKIVSPESGSESDKCLKLNMKDHKYKVVNSCNGLLCLSDPSDNDPVIVCNPITGEFINLPKGTTPKQPEVTIDCGFGFNPKTNQFKVLRLFTHLFIDDTNTYNKHLVCEVHVLGSQSWKDIGFFPQSMRKSFHVNLNGFLYWFSLLKPDFVISFDLDKESFETIPAPPLEVIDWDKVSMGVLGGELCISDSYILCSETKFWVMKDDGAKKYWSVGFSIDICPSDPEPWPTGAYQPIKFLNNGALLMFHPRTHALIYQDPKKRRYRFLKIRGMESKVEAIDHIPSFVSLKDVLSEHDVEVYNVNSRCGGLKLHKEEKGVSIVEEDRLCTLCTT